MARTKQERLEAVRTMALLKLEDGTPLDDLTDWLIAEIEHVVDPHYTVSIQCRHPQLMKLLRAAQRKRNRIFFDVELEVAEVEGMYFTLNDTLYTVTMRYATRKQPCHQ